VKNLLYNFILAACLTGALLQSACQSEKHNGSQESEVSAKEKAVSPPPQSANSSQVQVAQDNRPVIVAFGDSLTAGVAGRSYPEDLQELLDEHGYHYRVENQGVSGDTSTDGLARIENVIDAHPALVILEFGGNDGLRGTPIDSTRDNLKQMITRLQGANIPVVLAGITLPPNYGPEYVKPFTAMFPELAKQFHLRLLPFLLVSVYQHPEMMQPDGIHPNGAGNEVLARDVFSLIKPLLHKTGSRGK
jgi:acyl-CoA thioesterase-1